MDKFILSTYSVKVTEKFYKVKRVRLEALWLEQAATKARKALN